MTRLLSAELRKVWHSRFFLLAFSVLLGANLFLLWFGTGHKHRRLQNQHPPKYQTGAGYDPHGNRKRRGHCRAATPQ